MSKISIDSSELRQILLDNYCTATLPEFFSFGGLDNENYKSIGINYDNFIWTEPVEYFIPKPGSNGNRKYSLINPFSYVQTVNLLTDSSVLDHITTHLNKPHKIKSHTLKPKKDKDESISSWIEFSETDPPGNIGAYSHMLTADISRFYESIYTHSVAWALHGKSTAKSKMRDKTLLGNRIDNAVRSMNLGQTNGLLVGNGVSDFVSEIILREIDYLLEQKMGELDYIGSRYRDDYIFLTKSRTGAENIQKTLDNVLQKEFNLTLNYEKTFITDTPLRDYYPEWKDASRQSGTIQKMFTSKEISPSQLNTILREVYLIQQGTKKTVISLLTELSSKQIVGLDIEHEKQLTVSISYLLGLMRVKEDITPHVMSILSENIFSKISDDKLLLRLFVVLMSKLDQSTASEYQMIWLQRLIISSSKLNGVGLSPGAIGEILQLVIHADTANFFKNPDNDRLDSLGFTTIYRQLQEDFQIINTSKIEEIKLNEQAIEHKSFSLKYGGW